MAGGRELHAGPRPLLHDALVPVDLEPGDDGVRDDAADTVDLRELLAGRGADQVEGSEVTGQGARRHRPDVTDVEGHQEPPQRFRLRQLDLAQKLDGARRRLRALTALLLLGGGGVAPERGAQPHGTVVLFLGEPGLGVPHDDLDRQQVAEGEIEQSGLGG